MASILLDGLLVVLLIATIIYAIILDRRLRVFRQARDEMQVLLASFTAATVQAQTSMTLLRDTSQTTSADLKDQFERGKALRDDLAFLLDRGASLADRLENGISVARVSAKATDSRGKPDMRLADRVDSAMAQSRPAVERNDMRVNESRNDSRPTASRSEPRSAVKSEAAFAFLRALKTAR